jgi:putative transposase
MKAVEELAPAVGTSVACAVVSVPQLVATAPNQVWTWDITKLLGPAKWTYYYLYVILDIYSRYVVGWMLAGRESQHLAERLIRETLIKEGIGRDQLTIHSDRGAAMRSQAVAQLLATLGVTKSHSRPHVSDDNPFSESQFKTLKYRPDFPVRFASQDHGLDFCRGFFHWHNEEHCHWGIGLLTPAAEVWINPPETRPTVRTRELPRDTQFVPQLSQSH